MGDHQGRIRVFWFSAPGEGLQRELFSELYEDHRTHEYRLRDAALSGAAVTRGSRTRPRDGGRLPGRPASGALARRGLPHRAAAAEAERLAACSGARFCGSGPAAAAREARHGPCAYAAEQLPRPPGGTGRGRAAHRLYLPRFPVQPAEPAAPSCRLAGDGMERRQSDRPVHDGLDGRSCRCAAAAHCAVTDCDRQRARSGGISPGPAGAGAHPRGARRAGGARCRRDRLAAGAPQGAPGIAGGDGIGAECGAVGGGRPAVLGSWRGSGALFRRERAGRPAATAGLSGRYGGGAGGGRHLRPAEPFRGAADVSHRGDANGPPRCRDGHPRPARAGGGWRDRIAGAATRGRASGGGAASAGRRSRAPGCHGSGGAGAGARNVRRGADHRPHLRSDGGDTALKGSRMVGRVES